MFFLFLIKRPLQNSCKMGRVGLSVIDRLEGHPRHYKREKVRVRLEDGREVEAWLYFLNSENGLFERVVRYGRLNRSGEYPG